MKKMLPLLALVCLSTLLSGCASRYVMETQSGDMIITKGKPETDKATGLVTYKDLDGNKIEINRSQIRQIMKK